MKIRQAFAKILCWGLPLIACADEAKVICFDSPPGEEGIPLDSHEQIRLEKISLSDKGHIGYIATEYIEAANLQASIYIKTDGKYCFAGQLGPLINFHIDKSKKSNEHYDLVIDSKSGQTKFSRGFSFQSQKYVLSWCNAVDSGTKVRACTTNEMAVDF